MNHFHCKACNYEFKQEIIKGKLTVVHGENEPIFIGSAVESEFEKTELYACPACHTVKALL